MVFLLGASFLTAEEFTTGGIYVQVASENQTCNFISKDTNFVEKIVVGKTYRIEADVMEFKTKATDSIDLALSTGLQIKVNPNTTFSIDSFNQLIVNDESQPAAIQAQYSVTALSLMDGEVELIAPKFDTNSQCILQTPLVNVNVAEGRLVVKSNPKWVMLNAIEGGVTVVDSKNKTTFIDKGQMGLIIQYPGRDDQIMVTQKVISPDELDKMTASLNKLATHSKDVLFIVIDKRIVGVRLK